MAAIAPFWIKEFGARFPYYKEVLVATGLPGWIWGFGNFDGVHYIGIAQNGYFAQYTQAFFPLYPLVIKLAGLGQSAFLSGLIVSNIFFLVALILLFQLFKLDYNNKISLGGVLLLLAFPTAFYFGAIYSESLFLLLAVASLLFIRKRMFLLGGIMIALASATRIVGLFLLPIILWELYMLLKQRVIKVGSAEFYKALAGVVISAFGTAAYMLYLKLNFGDPLYFLHAQPAFGADRSSSLILLPQVLFRYFKILTTISPLSLPFFNAVLEVIFTVVPLVLIVWAIKKTRVSYIFFALGCLILPTLTGTLSSMPRYSLMSFLIFPFIVEKLGKYFKLVVILLIIMEIILVSLFTRGYWVS